MCCFHSSPKGKDGLCTGSFNEKLVYPLLPYVLYIWSSSGSRFPLLRFCRGFAQTFLLFVTSPASKAQGSTKSYAELNQKWPEAYHHCNSFQLPCTDCPNTLQLQLTPDTNLSQIPPPSSSTRSTCTYFLPSFLPSVRPSVRPSFFLSLSFFHFSVPSPVIK